MSESEDAFHAIRQARHDLERYGIRIRLLGIRREALYVMLSSEKALSTMEINRCYTEEGVDKVCGIPFEQEGSADD